mgnify:FL=1
MKIKTFTILKRNAVLIFVIFFNVNTCLGQANENYSDNFLTQTFKTYHSADREMANYLEPFLRTRLDEQLKDTLSLTNPFDSLSKYVRILNSSDSAVKYYGWSVPIGNCCYGSSSFIQFRDSAGKIKHHAFGQNTDDPDWLVYDIYPLKLENEMRYLLLGWGSCCGGKHHKIARIYKIKNDSFVQCDSVFSNDSEIRAGANRRQKIEMSYSPKSRTLSYNAYSFDDTIGFYTHELELIKWKLVKWSFIRK